MKVPLLDLHCLNAVADDLETAASILDDVWFRITDRGRRHLDANWVDE